MNNKKLYGNNNTLNEIHLITLISDDCSDLEQRYQQFRNESFATLHIKPSPPNLPPFQSIVPPSFYGLRVIKLNIF